MIDLPLTHDQWTDYLDVLFDTHLIDVQFTIYDKDEQPQGSMTHPANRVVSASLTADSTADVSRSLELTLIDPNDALRFEANNPTRAAVYADHFVGVHYGVYIPKWDDGTQDPWFYCPVFRGPVTNFSRDGMQVNIECQGKESRMLAPHYVTRGFTLDGHTRIDDGITKCLKTVGERRIRLPNLPQKIRGDYIIAPEAELWPVIAGGKHIDGTKRVIRHHKGKNKGEVSTYQNVNSLIRMSKSKRYLMYDGRGSCTTRHKNAKPHFVFRDGVMARGAGRGASVLTRPRVEYDEQEVVNTVVARGFKPKGKERLEIRESLHPAHPLSPHALARNGEPVFATIFIDAPNVKKEDELRERAREELKDHKDVGVTYEFDSLPVPFLDPGDAVKVHTEEYKFEFNMEQFTIPLVAGDSMSVGYTKQIDKFAHHKRRRHHHGKGGEAGPPGGRGGSD